MLYTLKLYLKLTTIIQLSKSNYCAREFMKEGKPIQSKLNEYSVYSNEKMLTFNIIVDYRWTIY